jgi:hypothetical protein
MQVRVLYRHAQDAEVGHLIKASPRSRIFWHLGGWVQVSYGTFGQRTRTAALLRSSSLSGPPLPHMCATMPRPASAQACSLVIVDQPTTFELRQQMRHLVYRF